MAHWLNSREALIYHAVHGPQSIVCLWLLEHFIFLDGPTVSIQFDSNPIINSAEELGSLYKEIRSQWEASSPHQQNQTLGFIDRHIVAHLNEKDRFLFSTFCSETSESDTEPGSPSRVTWSARFS